MTGEMCLYHRHGHQRLRGGRPFWILVVDLGTVCLVGSTVVILLDPFMGSAASWATSSVTGAAWLLQMSTLQSSSVNLMQHHNMKWMDW